MTRTQKAALLDQLEVLAAEVRGRIARAHNRPLGGALEPKHASPELAAAFRAGWKLQDGVMEAVETKPELATSDLS